MIRRAQHLGSAGIALLLLLLSAAAAFMPSAAAGGPTATIGAQSYPFLGVNVSRVADALVGYTQTPTQLSSPANVWGAEVAVFGGVVTAVTDRQSTNSGPMPIPMLGMVLSGHGAARTWLLANAKVGAKVSLPPADKTPPMPLLGTARIGSSTFAVAALNAPRPADALVLYSRAGGQVASPANEWGTEAAVVANKVTEVRDRQSTGAPAIRIPEGGYVLSGHGAARLWLNAQARIGSIVAATAPSASAAPSPTPTPSPTPSPTPTPSPSPTPTASPTPTPTPTPSPSNLPNKVVGGYLTTWEARNGVTLRSLVHNTDYNLIYVAFALGQGPGSGALRLDNLPGLSGPAQTKAEIAYANSKGTKVIVSVGGYLDFGYSANPQFGYVLNNSSRVSEFMGSMRSFRTDWGFNGMDWDLEHGNRSDIAGILSASTQMRAEFGNPWIIAAAPGPDLSTWQTSWGVGFDTWAAQNGLHSFDLYGEQIYDLGANEAEYRATIVRRMTSISRQFGSSRAALGNKYKNDTGTSMADPSDNFVDISTTRAALADLRSAGVNIRGAYVWTIQSDSDANFAWQSANGVGGDVLGHP